MANNTPMCTIKKKKINAFFIIPRRAVHDKFAGDLQNIPKQQPQQ